MINKLIRYNLKKLFVKKGKKEIILESPNESHHVAMQTIKLETDLFSELPCFVEGHNTYNVSHIPI